MFLEMSLIGVFNVLIVLLPLMFIPGVQQRVQLFPQ